MARVQSLEKTKNKHYSTPKSIWDDALVFSIRKGKQSEGSRSREKRDEVGKERAKRAGRR